ncbi:uncharacterized protein LOC135686129 [Rhopilema esculentum]|uniref:uncharacterized protein LOC135686129 n=1 Tax=Rhopilema esculentum TaxID=499914 RepID=UPI0031DADC70
MASRNMKFSRLLCKQARKELYRSNMSSCEERQILLAESGRKKFHKKAIKCFAILQLTLGITFICLAWYYPGTTTVENNLCRIGDNSSELFIFEKMLVQDGKNISIFSYIIIGNGATMIINGFVGISSALKPKSHFLNAANFCVGTLCFLYALFGLCLCNLTTYIEAAVYERNGKSGDGMWFVASLESLAYLESLLALGILLVCWMQRRCHWCSCMNCHCGENCQYERLPEDAINQTQNDVLYETMTGAPALQKEIEDQYVVIDRTARPVSYQGVDEHLYENIKEVRKAN